MLGPIRSYISPCCVFIHFTVSDSLIQVSANHLPSLLFLSPQKLGISNLQSWLLPSNHVHTYGSFMQPHQVPCWGLTAPVVLKENPQAPQHIHLSFIMLFAMEPPTADPGPLSGPRGCISLDPCHSVEYQQR